MPLLLPKLKETNSFSKWVPISGTVAQTRAYKNAYLCQSRRDIYTSVQKLPDFIQLNSIRTMRLGGGNSNNIKMILLCLPNQFLFFPLELSDVSVAHAKILTLGTNSSTDTVRCSHLPPQTRGKCIDGFPVTVSLCGRM